MKRKFHIKKGDMVIINTGVHKGRKGRVLQVYYDEEKAIVEGVNMISKHTKPSAKNPQGGITKKEAPVHISNINLIDPLSGKASRIGRKMGKNNKLVRYAKKSGEEIK